MFNNLKRCSCFFIFIFVFVAGGVWSLEQGQLDKAPEKKTAKTPVSETNEKDDDEDDSRFSWFSLAPEIGFAYFPESSIEVKGLNLKVEARKSFVGKVHLDLGGDGGAIELVPFIGVESTGGDWAKPNFSSGLEGGLGGNFVAIGGQINFVYRLALGNFFPHLGMGFHSAYLTSDEIKYGAEFYGRIPLGFTWYFAKHLGFVFELGLMYGATGIRGIAADLASIYGEYGIPQDTPVEDLSAQDLQDYGVSSEDVNDIISTRISQEIKFGVGFAMDLTIGLRFP